ncbi:NAD(P)-dependent dehydrogenase, short-chain alcohol dehydrogenase family [Marinobacter sp. DSM 26671]|uniref:SDR family NAD(P)-dependent oxidoreductase n=1 Tax=Marinobacter sp. DSM 26671 TaxID=1761793 RepID=UPI0008F356CD|nr:SDR family oxidoreductase [Marinobacter sp. DSM 26671]SFE23493.1 NAD(P)-dependent dehydrogenase, short-chain alcohol dehydrogenase family [Marinobacter sp. DSM 26671]
MTSDQALFSLAGKTALITGATGHLGSAMAEAMAIAGARVLVNGRDPQKCESLSSELRSKGFDSVAAVFDVSDRQAVAEYFKNKGPDELHVLVNNAYAGGAGSIESASPESFLQSYDVAVVASHYLFQQALPALRRAVDQDGDASVINIASMYGVVSPDQRLYPNAESANPPFYGAAKAALLQWTRYAACEFGKEGIRVNAICPGPFPAKSVQDESPEFIEKLAARVPMGRIGGANEIAGPTVFLASVASSYVNGASLMVDGGWTAW